MKLKMLKKGSWCDNPKEPIIEVEEGAIVEFSERLTKISLDSGKAEIYIDEEAKEAKAAEEAPTGAVDPAKALGVAPALLDKAKAEKKGGKRKK